MQDRQADASRDKKGSAKPQGTWLTVSLMALNALIGLLLIIAVGISIARTQLFTVARFNPYGLGRASTATSVPELNDYDLDADGLIEVADLAQLHAIRHDLDGNGAVTDDPDGVYAAAFPDALEGMGCPAPGCAGYELAADLDFDENGDGQITGADATYWHGGRGWMPIGDWEYSFGAVFQGNGHTISRLFIDDETKDNVGLFGRVGYEGRIEKVELLDIKVTGGNFVGGLVGDNRGAISRSVVQGRIAGARNYVGGLVGWNLDNGTITASAAEGAVAGGHYVGGLAGSNAGAITDSTAKGTVAGARNYVGGLVGWNLDNGTITASVAKGAVTGERHYVGGLVGLNGGAIVQSAAEGFVSGPADLGGLAGANYGAIADSTAIGTVARAADADSWAGAYYGIRVDSVAAGFMSLTADTGGLTGNNYGAITDSYWEFRYFDPVTSTVEPPPQRLRQLELAP